MSSQRLGAMLNPETIAFVGASEDSARFVSIHGNVTSYEDDRSRDHYYVNPNRESVFGHPCHDSITDIDATVDLAVLITPASVVPQVFEECCTAGVGAAIVVSAGFAEAGEEGRRRNERLVELSEAYDLPFCGPNTYGVLSTHDRLAAIQASSLDATAGNVAAVLQSGGLLNQVIYSSIERGIGLSTVVDSGNEASVGASEYFEYLLEDDRTDVILGVLEGITDPERFLTVAERALERETPIVVLKLARSAKGSEIARSHTGAITTPDDVVTAAFRQYGVVQVPSLDLLIDAAALFSRRQRISGPNVGVVEISGGGCALFSDAVAETDLSLPELSPETHAAVDLHIPDIGATRNPVDLAMGWGSSEMDRAYPAVLDAFADDPTIDVVVSRLSVPRTGEASTAKRRLAQLAERASGDATEGTAFAIVSRTSGGVSEDWIAAVADAGVPFLQGYHKGTEALALLAGYSAALDRRAEYDRSPPSVTPIDRDPDWSANTRRSVSSPSEDSRQRPNDSRRRGRRPSTPRRTSDSPSASRSPRPTYRTRATSAASSPTSRTRRGYDTPTTRFVGRSPTDGRTRTSTGYWYRRWSKAASNYSSGRSPLRSDRPSSSGWAASSPRRSATPRCASRRSPKRRPNGCSANSPDTRPSKARAATRRYRYRPSRRSSRGSPASSRRATASRRRT